MRFLLLTVFSAIGFLSAQAWQLEGSVWGGADEYDNTHYYLKITSVTPKQAGFFDIEGIYKSGFDDAGECKDDSFAFTGTYYEPEATITFTVDWYNVHNPGCRTVSAYAGVIYSSVDMKMHNLFRYPNQGGNNIESWIINWERQINGEASDE